MEAFLFNASYSDRPQANGGHLLGDPGLLGRGSGNPNAEALVPAEQLAAVREARHGAYLDGPQLSMNKPNILKKTQATQENGNACVE